MQKKTKKVVKKVKEAITSEGYDLPIEVYNKEEISEVGATFQHENLNELKDVVNKLVRAHNNG